MVESRPYQLCAIHRFSAQEASHFVWPYDQHFTVFELLEVLLANEPAASSNRDELHVCTRRLHHLGN